MIESPDRRRRLFAVALGVVAFVSLLPGLGRIGITWDEPKYYDSAERIQEWTAEVIRGPDRAGRLSAEGIKSAWDPPEWHFWNPHPPVYKAAMALTEATFGGVVGSIRGYRLAPAIWFGLLVAALFLVGARAGGTAVGAGAAISLLVMPRVFGHAHFAVTDTPLMFFWFVATVGLVRWVTAGDRSWGVLGAMCLGLAIGTKFTGYLLVAPLFVWLLLFERSLVTVRRTLAWGLGGLVLWFIVNPLAWHHPVGYTLTLFAESLDREAVVPIRTYYLGTQFGYVVPWHEAIVLFMVTTPVSLLVLAGLGTLRGAVLREDRIAVLCVIQFLFFMGLMALPSSPNHDGIRLFLPMYPFVALLSGVGFGWIVERIRSGTRGQQASLAIAAAGLLFFLPPYVQSMRIAPFYLSYYNETIGGLSGAEQRGMEVTYWYDSITPGFLEQLNEALPPGARLATFPTLDYFLELQQYGVLRDDIEIVFEFPAPYYLQITRKALFEPLQWGLWDNVDPVLTVTHDNVVLTSLYVWSESDELVPSGDQ